MDQEMLFVMVMGVIQLGFVVLMVASWWKLFTKAGKPGWASMVPIYNIIVFLEIIEKPAWHFLLLCIPCVGIYFGIVYTIQFAEKYGASPGFAVGMLLLAPIFNPLLAFGAYPFQAFIVEQLPSVVPKPADKPEAKLDPKPDAAQRLVSLDVYRGLIMVTLAFNGFGLAATASNHLKSDPAARLWEPVGYLREDAGTGFWEAVRYQFSHAEWVGCSYWDLIQPSFMFMVGVAMAFSYLKRKQLGHSYGRMLLHAVWRSLVLIFLGIFLISNFRPATEWSLMNVLTQIGLGYTFLFLLWDRSVITQAVAAVGLLLGTQVLYAMDTGSGIDLNKGNERVKVSADWAQKNLRDVPAAWHKSVNMGHSIDYLILNLASKQDGKENYQFNSGGYQTVNFVPSLATMIFGLMCGELLRAQRSNRQKLLWLVGGGALGLAAGTLLHLTDVSPLIKRLWTPSWALFSTGWCCLILAGLFGVIDVLGWKRWWTFPLVVVGMNSIAIYCMSQLLKPWVSRTLRIHLGDKILQDIGAWFSELVSPHLTDLDHEIVGKIYQPTVEACLVGLVFFVMCLWMYRQKIFIRI